jgi:hypothetical protein
MDDVFNITQSLDFDKIHDSYEIGIKLSPKECFLGKKTQLTSIDSIKRVGDILYGIKNNESCSIKVTIYCNSRQYEVCIINSGETYRLKSPILLIKLYMNNLFTYEVEKMDLWYLYALYDFLGMKHPNSPVNIEFIYGYLTQELREEVSLSKCFVRTNDDVVCLYDVRCGNAYMDIWIYAWLNPLLVTHEYYNLFVTLNTSWPNKTEFENDFFRMNSGWVEFK